MSSDRLLFDSALMRMGHFSCAAHEDDWIEDNIIRHATLVFPSVPVRIQHADRDAVVADRNVVMYYNEAQVYRRGLLDERGDEAVWVSLKEGLWGEVAGEVLPAAAARSGHPFDHTHGPNPERCYLRHRSLAGLLARGEPLDPLAVEEAVLSLVGDLLRANSQARGGGHRCAKRETARERARTAEQVRELLSTDPGGAWTLERIVERIPVSPSHLCRVFRRETGLGVHAYLTQLRLREAADSVLDGERDLTGLAMRLGFSNHSHFTEAFRRAFGRAPSRLRDADTVLEIATKPAAA